TGAEEDRTRPATRHLEPLRRRLPVRDREPRPALGVAAGRRPGLRPPGARSVHEAGGRADTPHARERPTGGGEVPGLMEGGAMRRLLCLVVLAAVAGVTAPSGTTAAPSAQSPIDGLWQQTLLGTRQELIQAMIAHGMPPKIAATLPRMERPA